MPVVFSSYQHARDKLVGETRLLGRITNVSGQWHKAVSEDFGVPRGQEIPEAKLHKYGYPNMHEFRNWRWFKKYAGGPISDLAPAYPVLTVARMTDVLGPTSP